MLFVGVGTLWASDRARVRKKEPVQPVGVEMEFSNVSACKFSGPLPWDIGPIGLLYCSQLKTGYVCIEMSCALPPHGTDRLTLF